MPFNGSTPNVFQRVYNWGTDKINGIPVTASRVDTEDDGFAAGLSLALLRDGSQQVSANMPWNGYHITGYGSTSAAAARTDVPAWGQVQDGAANYVVAGGSGDGLTLTLSPAITAYTAGQVFWARLTARNTLAAPTLSVSGLTAKTIKKRGGTTAQPLVADDLYTGNIAVFAYNATADHMELISPAVEIGLGANTWTGAQTFSAGIVLGGNETLLTYDEGTFVPGVMFGGAATGVTYTSQVGRFTKIGRSVQFVLNIILSAEGSSNGALAITNLPFTSAATGFGGVSIGYLANYTLDALFTQVVAFVDGAGTTIEVFEVGSGQTTTAINRTHTTNTFSIQIGGSYDASTS